MQNTLHQLLMTLDEGEEIYGEIVSQNASERAMYGDSAPGSALHEAGIWQSICDLRREIAAHPDYVPPVAYVPCDDPNDDCSF